MRGGVSFDPAANAYRAIVHSWDNAECIGEPQEWRSAETFASGEAAMGFYKTSIRPGLERKMPASMATNRGAVIGHHAIEPANSAPPSL